MKREPFTVGSYVHVIKRGARGLPIFKCDADKWRCLLMLHHFNDSFHSENWYRELADEHKIRTFERFSLWPKQQPIVSVLAFTLMPNHLHLILKEVRNGGIALFMGKLGKGMTLHANIKYKEKGSMFQGPYRSRTLKSDAQLRTATMYVMVKNTFELYRGGLDKASAEFEKAYLWGMQYAYSSLMEFNCKRDIPLVDKDILGELFPTPAAFKSFARDYIAGRTSRTSVEDSAFLE